MFLLQSRSAPIRSLNSSKSVNLTASALACLISLSPAFMPPAIAQGSGSTGSNPYKRTAGFGFSNPYKSSVNHPSFGIPIDQGGGYFAVPSGGKSIPMWKAPSGYLYPWAPGPRNASLGYALPVLVVSKQSAAATPAAPPLSVVIQDLENYMGTDKVKAKLAAEELSTIKTNVDEIKNRERTLRITGHGTLNPGDEALMRREISRVGKNLAALLNK